MCKEHNSDGNSSTETKFKLDLCILVTHLYTEFQFKMSVCDVDNEQKLKFISKSKGHNSAKNDLTGPKFLLNLRALVTHLYHKFQFKTSICDADKEQKLKTI